MKTVLKLFLSLLFTYILIEIGSFILLKTKFRTAHFPTFHSAEPTSFTSTIAEISPEWGIWHYPNIHTTRKLNCLEFTVNTNSVGARDIERTTTGDTNRIVFIGDSFIEGSGLEEPQRVSNILEKRLGKQVLNFGCGWFTPTQEYLNYKFLASKYDHNTIIWALLPFNDFYADDTSYHEQDRYVHYQPFFEGTYPDYKLFYREDSLSKSTFNKENFHKAPRLKGKLKFYSNLQEYTFWANIFFNIKGRYEGKKPPTVLPSYYFDYTHEQLQKLFYIIDQLKKQAAGKRIIIITIPVQDDLIRAGNQTIPPLTSSMDSFCRSRSIEYLDLLGGFRKNVKNPADLYLECDGHWNSHANQLAADILMPLLKNR